MYSDSLSSVIQVSAASDVSILLWSVSVALEVSNFIATFADTRVISINKTYAAGSISAMLLATFMAIFLSLLSMIRVS